MVSRLSVYASTVRSAGLMYAHWWPQCSRSARRRCRKHNTRAHEYDDCSTARRPRRQFARA
eukprot:121328-Prymnesium_polylepis.1